MKERITYFGRINSRSDRRMFGIKQSDRRYHFYTLGRTGTGKSTLLLTLLSQDIRAGEGVALLDPHGDLAEAARDLVPESRQADLVYLDPADPKATFTFNPLAGIRADEVPLQAAGIVDVFKKLWMDSWGPRLEHLLRNVIYTLLEVPGSTFADISPLFLNRAHRQAIVGRVKNREVREFWECEYASYSPGVRGVATAPILNKVGAFMADPRVRRVLIADKSSLDLPAVMNGGKILIVNLSKGRLGEGPASLLGSLLLSHINLEGLRRAAVAEVQRRDFAVYLDEFQTFSTLALAEMLSELRKYRISLVLAHQHLSQLTPEVRDAVLGNVGTIVSFRTGVQDASLLGKEFAPVFKSEDLVSLPNYEVAIRMMIDGAVSRGFSAVTLRHHAL